MKVIIKSKKEVEIKTLLIEAQVRYWDDATVNGINDENGDLIPCRKGDSWCLEIDIDSGVIINWTKGLQASVHYKVCDAGSYYLKDSEGNVILSLEDNYVPDIVPGEYGDYIIMEIDENGKIENWRPNPSICDFLDRNED